MEHNFKSTVHDSDFNDVDVTVFFEYSPSEARTLTYPGCDEEATINAAYLDSDKSMDIIEELSDKTINLLQQEAIEMLATKAQDDYDEYASERRASQNDDLPHKHFY
ncbi:MAG: hypothetical protein RPR28_06435 [Cycloclasticus sp.]